MSQLSFWATIQRKQTGSSYSHSVSSSAL